MKVGDLVKLHSSRRRNGEYGGKLALIVDWDKHENPIVNVEGEIKKFHYTQVEGVVNASR